MLSEVNKVDLVLESPDGDRFALALVIEPDEWQQPKAKWWLQEKVNHYAAFALDGEMAERFPDSIGKPVSIAIQPVGRVPQDLQDFIAKIAAALAPHGLPVAIQPIQMDQAA